MQSNTSTLVSQGRLRDLAQAGWLTGKVVSKSPDGVYRLITDIGEISISIKKSEFELGSRLLISYDKETGKVFYRAVEMGRVLEAPQKAAEAPNKTDVTRTLSMSSPALQAALLTEGMERVQATAAAGNTFQASQSLSQVFPQAGNSAFALMVSLFPMVVRGGVLARLASGLQDRYGNQTRLSKLTQDSLVPAVPRVSKSEKMMAWNMPFFSAGDILSSRWGAWNEASEDEKKPIQKVSMEVEFEYAGMVSVDAGLDGEFLFVDMVSEKQIDEEVIEEIREIVELLSKGFKWTSSFRYRWEI